jgi:hypothetical protein
MHARIHIPDEQILACKEFHEVLNLCLRMSGRGLQEVAWDCGWRDGGRVLSRMTRPAPRPGAARHMPGDKLDVFMKACGNEAPFRWLELRKGTERSGVEEQLAEVRQTLAELVAALHDMGVAISAARPRYSVVRRCGTVRFGVAEWLRRTAAEVAEGLMSITIVDESWQMV